MGRRDEQAAFCLMLSTTRTGLPLSAG